MQRRPLSRSATVTGLESRVDYPMTQFPEGTDADPHAALPSWRARSTEGRRERLRWFLRADLRQPAAIRKLRQLGGEDLWLRRPRLYEVGGVTLIQTVDDDLAVGAQAEYAQQDRELRILGPDMVVPSEDHGLWRGQGPVRIDEVVSHFERLQAVLRQAREMWARARREPLARRGDTLTARLDDVTGLARVRPDYVRDRRGFVRWPLERTFAAEELRAELALAAYEEMSDTAAAGLCEMCGEVWVSADARHSRRRTCSAVACGEAYLKRYRQQHPEKPGSSTERVRKLRAKQKTKRKRS